MKDTIRLDKYLTEMGEGTRSQIKEMARKGRITVNSVTEKKSDRKISPSSDVVAVDGRIVAYAEYEYYMLHKPEGVAAHIDKVTLVPAADVHFRAVHWQIIVYHRAAPFLFIIS